MAKDDAFENTAGPPRPDAAPTRYSYLVLALSDETAREIVKVRLAAGQLTALFAPTRLQAPPAWRSSHQAWPNVPGAQRRFALRVAELAVTLVARVVLTAQPAVKTTRAAAAASSFFILE